MSQSLKDLYFDLTGILDGKTIATRINQINSFYRLYYCKGDTGFPVECADIYMINHYNI